MKSLYRRVSAQFGGMRMLLAESAEPSGPPTTQQTTTQEPPQYKEGNSPKKNLLKLSADPTSATVPVSYTHLTLPTTPYV